MSAPPPAPTVRRWTPSLLARSSPFWRPWTAGTRWEEGYVSADYVTIIDAAEAASSGSASEVVDLAMQYLGYPYCYGGSSPSGFDCSGFVRYVYSQFGCSLNRTASAQMSNGTSVSMSELSPAIWSSSMSRAAVPAVPPTWVSTSAGASSSTPPPPAPASSSVTWTVPTTPPASWAAAGSSDFLPLRYTGQADPAGPACPFSVCVFFLLFGHTVLRYAPRHPLAGEERSTS